MLNNYSPFRTYRDNFAPNSHVRSQLILGSIPSKTASVSILIPTFRRPLLLKQALFSALLQQNFCDYEVLVIDNDSEATDPTTEAVIQSYSSERLRYYRNEKNLGMVGNWNRALELANGRWVTLLHDDDWLDPNFLSAVFDNIPSDASIIASSVITGLHDYRKDFLSNLSHKKGELLLVTPARLALGCLSPAPGVVFSKSHAMTLGGFDPDFYPCADYDFHIRMAINYRAYLLSDVLAYYRTSDSETNKGDTLKKIVMDSMVIKTGLLKFFPTFTGAVFWLESIKSLCQKAEAQDQDIQTKTRAEKVAKWISKRVWLSKVTWYLMRVVDRIDRRNNLV